MQEFRLMSVGDYNAKALLYDFLNTHRPTLHSCPRQSKVPPFASSRGEARPMESGVKEVKKLDKIVDHRSSLALLSVLFEVLDLRAHPSHHLTRQLRRVTSEQASFVHAPAGEVVERFSEEQGKNTAMGKQP